jgi:cytochrome oxidase Cu insertion factor (SCO1/SenC/PrrC family)
MQTKKSFLVFLIFGIPFLLGVSIVGYWYWTTRIEKQSLLPTFGTVPEFTLTAEDHRTITQRDLLEKVSIVDFIFTECAGTCPMMSTKMSDLQRTLTGESAIQFVSYSVDPETDTPEVLTEYAKHYGADLSKWIFLTGNKSAIYRLSKEGFHLGLDIEGDNAIIHSQKFVLVDHHGAIRGYYDSEDEEVMKNLVRDAKILSSRVHP